MTKAEPKKKRKLDLKWWVLITVIIGTFLGRLDQTIVNLALPKIIDDFGITVSAAAWIGTAYILANAVFVPIWGKLGDTLGRKKIYMIGFTVFIIGSALAGLAWDLTSMIVFRVIQAIAGSADYPTAMAIIAVTFREGKERAEVLGLWSVSFAAASVFGPLLGGPLIDMFGWRSVFLINIPIGILGIIMAMIFIDESRSESKNVKFDWWGAICLGIALSALVLVLDKGLEWGWLSATSLMMYAITIAFFTIFYRIEKKHPEPIVDFKFFRIPVFVGAMVNNFIVFMAMIGAVFAVPVFIAVFMGYSATQTGYLFMPMAFFMVIASAIGGRLVGKVKSHVVIALSTLIAAIGVFLFTIFLDPRSGPLDIMMPISVMAFGIGLAMSQRTSAIASAVDEKEIGIASSVLALGRNIAGAFGIAIFATILQNATEGAVVDIMHNSIFHIATQTQAAQALGLVYMKAQMVGYITIFQVAAAILLIGAIIAFFVRPKVEKNITVHVD